MSQEKSTIKIPCGQALVALEVLAHFAAHDFPSDQGRLRFAVARAFAALRSVPEVVACDAARQAAARHHGKEADGKIQVPPENVAAFIAEYGPVADEEIELRIAKLPAAVAEFVPPGVTPNDLIPLMPFIEE
jgi:hypothetical protein